MQNYLILRCLLPLLVVTIASTAEDKALADGNYFLSLSISDMHFTRTLTIKKIGTADYSGTYTYRIATDQNWGTPDPEQEKLVVFGKLEKGILKFIIPDTNRIAPYYFEYPIDGAKRGTGHVRFNGPHKGNDDYQFNLDRDTSQITP